MKRVVLSEGQGRTQVSLSTDLIGDDLIVCLFNENGHLGAVAVADFSHEQNRASTSVLTRMGHKDDSVAYGAAYRLCKDLKRPVCAIAGIHLDNITQDEIAQIMRNCNTLVEKLGRQLTAGWNGHPPPPVGTAD
jgi:hypothetical protein